LAPSYFRRVDSVQEPPAAISVEYTLTPDELIPVLRWQLLKSAQVRLQMGVVAVFGLVGIIILAAPKAPAAVGGVFLGVAVLYLALYLFLVRQIPVRVAKRAVAAARGPMKLEFTDDAVHVHTALSDAVNQWAVYSETVQHGDVYMLKIGKRRAYTIVPRRAFRSAYDESEFRKLVARHTAAQLESSPSESRPRS
jgi:hypothetical protein